MIGSSSLTNPEREAVRRTLAVMELCFGWRRYELAHGSPAEKRLELSNKARALIRYDRYLTGRSLS